MEYYNYIQVQILDVNNKEINAGTQSITVYLTNKNFLLNNKIKKKTNAVSLRHLKYTFKVQTQEVSIKIRMKIGWSVK